MSLNMPLRPLWLPGNEALRSLRSAFLAEGVVPRTLLPKKHRRYVPAPDHLGRCSALALKLQKLDHALPAFLEAPCSGRALPGRSAARPKPVDAELLGQVHQSDAASLDSWPQFVFQPLGRRQRYGLALLPVAVLRNLQLEPVLDVVD
jgi:hypothetical protein